MKGLNKNNGFTLLELILVIIIASILSAAIYFKWGRSTTILDAQTPIFVNILRYTQNLSVSKNERCRLVITGTNSFEIKDSNNNIIPKPGSLGASGRDILSNISFGSTTNLTSANTIIFDGKGTPYYIDASTGNEEKLLTDATITLTNSSGETRTVYITKTTGKISS